jgi:hypothetical protein
MLPISLSAAGPVAQVVGPAAMLWASGVWVVLSVAATLSVPAVWRLSRDGGDGEDPGLSPQRQTALG